MGKGMALGSAGPLESSEAMARVCGAHQPASRKILAVVDIGGEVRAAILAALGRAL